MNTAKAYIRLVRPRQWAKGIFILAPLFFGRELLNGELLSLSLWAVVAFSLAASAVYVFNDIVDASSDARHPVKKYRPIASGVVSKGRAWILSAGLLIAAIIISDLFVPRIALVLAVYVLLNIAYSLWLKRIVIIDILCVSFFYLLRVIAGGFVTGILISRWLILCTIFLTLFIVIAKRKTEFRREEKREVLRAYTSELIDHLLTISCGLTLLAYSVYTVLAVNSQYAVYSIIFVLIAVFRFLYLVYATDRGEFPEKLLLKDPAIVISGIVWVFFMIGLFYQA